MCLAQGQQRSDAGEARTVFKHVSIVSLTVQKLEIRLSPKRYVIYSFSSKCYFNKMNITFLKFETSFYFCKSIA